MNEKIIRIDLIKNLQEVLSSIEGMSLELFSFDDELSQGEKVELCDLIYTAISISADIEKAKRIVCKLKAFQKRSGGGNDAAD